MMRSDSIKESHVWVTKQSRVLFLISSIVRINIFIYRVDFSPPMTSFFWLLCESGEMKVLSEMFFGLYQMDGGTVRMNPLSFNSVYKQRRGR